MQQLHLIGFTNDHSGLIFSAANGSGSPGFVVKVDDDLLRSLEGLLGRGNGLLGPETANGQQHMRANPRHPPASNGRQGEQGSRLTPRDVQARLRLGQSVAQIAGDAGVNEAWVERFAGPILAERAQAVARALETGCGQPESDTASPPLGRVVATKLAEKGLRVPKDVFASSWSAWHLDGSRWAVRFSYLYRQRERVAEWEVDVRAGSLKARNREASELSRPAALAGRRGRGSQERAAAPGGDRRRGGAATRP